MTISANSAGAEFAFPEGDFKRIGKLHAGAVGVGSKVDKGSSFLVVIPGGKNHFSAEPPGSGAKACFYITRRKPGADSYCPVNETTLAAIDDDGHGMALEKLTGIESGSFWVGTRSMRGPSSSGAILSLESERTGERTRSSGG